MLSSTDAFDDEAEAETEAQHHWTRASMAANCCPHCGSRRLAHRHRARRVLGALGACAGAASSATRAWRGAELGCQLGAVANAPGALLGAIAGGVLGALAGGSTGCAIGVRLGEAIDRALLNDKRCLDCGQTFSDAPCASA